MKKPTFSTYVLVAMIVLFATNGFSQVLRSFNKEYDASLKGDILVIGNNVLNRDFGTVGDRANDPYNATGGSSVYNESINMKWINIDPDGGNNFNSSRAKLTIPAASRSCYKIVYAALYWSGTYSIAADRGSASGADRSVINKVRFKVGTNPFVNLTGTVIYDYTGTGAPTIPQNVPTTAQGARNPYACMLDVTNYVQAGGEVNYTVANIASSEGGAGSSAGHSGGWSLFVVYEDPKLPGKYITSYNGFTRIRSGDPSFSFPIDGFRSIPVGPVKAKLAFAALEGDNRDASDFMEISGATIAGSVAERLSTPAIRPIVSGVPNFFNSSINDEDSYFTDRTPNSINTMGYDTGVLTLSNPGNNTIKNSETSANITLGTGADWYYLFFTALSIEIIEPDIILTKRVLNQAGNDIGGTNVTFNDILNYVIRFQNVGNDNAQNFTIEDTLPINVIFNYPADIISLPAGVTVRSYNAATRKLIFDIDNGLVEKNDPYREFRIRVQVVAGCNALNDACSNNIDNIAVANYTGTIDPDSNTVISINSNNQCLAEPKATNFLVGIDGCVYATNITLCGNSLVLTAGNGYDKYAWSKSPFDSNGLPTGPIIGTGQSFTITDVGTYYVRNTAIAPCRSITQQFNVTRFGGVISNPLIPFADQVVICPDNGKQLPNIYLCGGNDSRTIRTGITGTDSIVWQRLSGGCATTTNPTCASEGSTCTWSTVGTGPDFTVNTAGEYRLVLNYAGGCFNLFYFNVYKNNFTPTATATDIYCNTPGRIVVTNPAQGTGYEYSLSPTGPFVATNTFTVTTAGIYTAYIRQVGVPTNPCVFDVKNLQVLNRTISVQEIVRQPLCFGDKGTVTLNINDVRGQYYLRFSKGTSTIVSPTPQSSNQFVINNLDVGSYNYTATTDDGCTQTGSITIVEPLILTATVALTKPLTCTAGEFVVTPVGGTAPYVFYVNGSTTFQSTLNPFSITTPLPPGGVFSIKVIDAKNCEATTSITVSPIPPPIYTMTQTNIKCYNDNIGVINFNVTNANGSTLAYSIDNGVTYLPTPTFSNLVAGTYNTIVRYTVGNEVCFAAAQPIVITQPSTALTASAGVSELAGCGPLGEGRIRITNPQGGTAPYEYSFDNQVSWTTINNAYKIPGTYTVYIRDANNCVYSMPNVIIDPKPVEPTIIVDDPMFNCDGTANSTVTVTNNGGVNYSYQYLLDGIPNTNVPPNVFRNVSSGTHTVSVAYTLQNVPTYSNLLNENFGYGEDTTSPGINTTFYCFERQVAATECKSSIRIDDGDYSVTSFIVEPFVPWVQPGDHTPQTVPPTPKGRSLVVNIGDQIATQDILYQKVINDIIPNQPINFEFFVMNLLETGNMQVDADLRIALLDASGTEISWFATGDIPKSEAWERYPKTPITLNPGNNSTLTFIIRSNKRATSGNDVAIDDIRVYQLPKTCITTKDFPFIIPTGKAFDAAIIGFKNVSCSGLNDGTITIAAQNFDLSKGFQYSINNGSTWITQLTSPYTITALAPATYTILMRADATATGACVITRSQIITAPAPLLASASVTAVSTCSTGATITASATGGTLAYRYELRDAGGVVIIRPYQLNPQFANISVGNYTVFVRDANNCIGSASTTINVVAVPTLTASLDSSSNLCLDNLNQGSLIVNVTGGTSPFTYSLNGGANQNSNTFNNLGAGTFNIVVTDSNNCTASISTIIIAPQLNVVANTTKILDCTPSPDAIITGTISGGAAPYTVTLLSGAGPGTIAQPSASTFTFTTATASVYQFRIQDAKGCIATATASINTLNSITATTAITNPTCNGALDGSVQIIPSGGVGPYTYSFNGSPFTGTSIYTNLIAGNSYPYEVRDSKNCLFTGTVILSEPTTLLTSAAATAFSCTPTNTKQSATITIAVPTTGTAPYQYSFNGSGYANVNSLTVNDNGTDQIITYSVKDAKGCIYTNTTTVLKLDAPTDLSFSASPVSCTNSTTTITATAANGVGTLTYSITFPLASAASNTTGVFAGLATGTYIFQVTDSNGCYYTESYIVNPVTPIVVTASKLTDVDCIGNSTGSLRYNVNGFGTTYSYSINGNPTVTGQTASSLSLLNLPAGT